MTNATIKPGVHITAYTSTFPARKYWYRHDRVQVNGQMLEGFIQTRVRAGRVECTTCFRDSCVMGHNVDWLIRQQQAASHA